MIRSIVEKTNEQTNKVCKKFDLDRFCFRYSKEGIKCLSGLLIVQGLCCDTK